MKTPRACLDPETPATADGAPRGGTRAALSAWVWDTIAIAYLMTGGYAFDPRLALSQKLSLNQCLGILLLGHLVWGCWQHRKRRVRARATLGTVLVLTALLIARSPGAINVEYARFKVFAHLLLVLPVLLHVEMQVRGPKDFRRMFQIMLLAAVALLLLSLRHMLEIEDGERLAVLAGGPNVFARLVGAGMVCSFVLFVLSRQISSRRGSVLSLIWLPLAVVALFLAGTKAVFLAVLLALAAVLWQLGFKKAVQRTALVLVLLAMVPGLTHDLVQERQKDGGIVRLLRLPDVGDHFGSFGSRIRYVRGTWEQMRTHRWLGLGTGDWGIRLGYGMGEAYPHNLLLEILAELGVVGLVLVMLPLLGFPRRTSKGEAELRTIGSGLLGLVAFWALNVQLSGDLVDSRYLWFSLALLEIHRRTTRSVAIGAENATMMPSGDQQRCELGS